MGVSEKVQPVWAFCLYLSTGEGLECWRKRVLITIDLLLSSPGIVSYSRPLCFYK